MKKTVRIPETRTKSTETNGGDLRSLVGFVAPFLNPCVRSLRLLVPFSPMLRSARAETDSCAPAHRSLLVLFLCRRPAEHRLHHVGRPRRARDRRVRVAGEPDAQSRPPRARGDEARQCLRDQLHLHAESRRDPDGTVFTLEWRSGVQPVRQLADDRGAAAAAGGLLHGHDWQVAPRQRSSRFRQVGDPARAGRRTRARCSTRRPARRRTRAST